MKEKILIVDDEEDVRESLKIMLKASGYDVLTASNGKQALKIVKKEYPKVILMDLIMPEMDGLKTLKLTKEIDKDIQIIMLTGHAEVNTAVEAMKWGAYHYLSKTCDNEELLINIERAIKLYNINKEIINLRTQLNRKLGYKEIVGKSKGILKVVNIAKKIAPTNTSVLLRGETGTGKELLARFIHRFSKRSAQVFIKFSPAAY